MLCRRYNNTNVITPYYKQCLLKFYSGCRGNLSFNANFEVILIVRTSCDRIFIIRRGFVVSLIFPYVIAPSPSAAHFKHSTIPRFTRPAFLRPPRRVRCHGRGSAAAERKQSQQPQQYSAASSAESEHVSNSGALQRVSQQRNNMLGRRNQKYQKVDVDAEPKDFFGGAASTDTPARRIFTTACLRRSLFTTVLIGIYFAPSIGLTFYQRWLLQSFKYPLFTVCIHMVAKLLLAVFIRSLIALKFGKQRLNLGWKEYLLAIAPAGVFSGIDIAFSNWGLERITVSLYTMAKSTTIIFILAFAILFKLEKKSWSLASIVTMISFGLFLVTYKASKFDLLGFVLVLIASMSSGIRWTCVQMLMQKSKLGMKSPIDMIYHMQGFMIVSVLPFMMTIEGSRLLGEFRAQWADDTGQFNRLVFKILLGAFIAFLMEISEMLVVSYTSSLTLSIAGIFKELIMLFLAFLSGDQFSPINVIGLMFCIAGIAIHVVHKITVLQAQTRTYEFDASDGYDFGVGKSLLEEQEIEQMHLSSESEEDQDSQEIFNILNRHDR